MHVLGDLVLLPPDSRIPLPWWHRAPLGLLHDTTVHVGITDPGDRPVGDLIVSVLDSGKSPNTYRVECQDVDQTGVLARIFGAVKPMNIALSEAITTLPIQDSNGGKLRRKHKVTFFCEPAGASSAPLKIEEEIAELESRLRSQALTPIVAKQEPLPPLLWSRTDRVARGWLLKTKWREEGMGILFPGAKIGEIDLSKAVVSADTDQRLLRYVFPRKGARTVQIEHRDEPGVLAELTNLLAELKINILSAFLRRGGAQPGNALLVATCEPTQPPSEESDFRNELQSKVAALSPMFRASLQVHSGRDSAKTIYVAHPEHVVAQVPKHLREIVQFYKQQFSREGRVPIFLSRRFIEGDTKLARFVKTVEQCLERLKCIAIQAKLTPEETPRTPDEVDATMWACEAGIVLVASGNRREISKAFSMNLAHEYGFIRGQGKPTLLLVEEGSIQALKHWSNSGGLNAPHFAGGAEGFDPNSQSSIERIIESWIHSWRNLP